MTSSPARSTFVFLDNSRSLQQARDELEKTYQGYRDLIIYPFTAGYLKGPTHLVVKMSPAGMMDKYLSTPCETSGEPAVAMMQWGYQNPRANQLIELCSILDSCLCSLEEKKERFSFTSWHAWAGTKSLTTYEFFKEEIYDHAMDAGAEIYLRDKAYFLGLMLASAKPSLQKLMDMTLGERGSITELDLSAVDTSQLTSMERLFRGLENVETLDLSSLDTSHVTNMEEMFFGCSSLHTVKMSSLNTSHVRNMHLMFYGCKSLKKLDLSSWDFSNVEEISGIFRFNNDMNDVEVIVSESLLHSKCRLTRKTGQIVERFGYVSTSPEQNTRSHEFDTMTPGIIREPETVDIPLSEATQEELCEHLGLYSVWGVYGTLTIV